jgi:prolipoprotein diacylglyceryltransferase
MTGFVHDLDPVLLRLGPLQVRYYGLVFAATLLAASGGIGLDALNGLPYDT